MTPIHKLAHKLLFAAPLAFGLAFGQEALSFTDALALINTSPAVSLAQLEIELAERQLEVAGSFVQGDLSGGYRQSWGETRFTPENPDLPQQTEDTSGGDWDPIALNLNFNVVPYGPAHEQVVLAQAALARAEANIRDERYRVAAEVTNGFQSARLTRLELDLREAQLELAELTLAEAETRFGVGAATPTELDAARLGVRQAEAARVSTEASLAQILESLAVTLGQPVPGVAGELGPVRPEFFNPEFFDTEAALERRSDVLNARLSLLEANINLASTRRQYLPSAGLSLSYNRSTEGSNLGLGAGYDTRSFQPSASFSLDPDFEPPGELENSAATSFSLGLSATVPLDVAVGSALTAGRLSIERSEQQLDRSRELARLDIKASQLELRSAQRAAELALAVLTNQQTTLETAQARFEAGVISGLELLATRNDTLQAELELRRAENTLRSAAQQLAIALAQNPLEVF